MSKRNKQQIHGQAEPDLQPRGWAEVEGAVIRGWARDPLGGRPAALFLTIDGTIAARLVCTQTLEGEGLPEEAVGEEPGHVRGDVQEQGGEEEEETGVEDAHEQLAEHDRGHAEAAGIWGGGRRIDNVQGRVGDVGVVEEGVVLEEGVAGLVLENSLACSLLNATTFGFWLEEGKKRKKELTILNSPIPSPTRLDAKARRY